VHTVQKGMSVDGRTGRLVRLCGVVGRVGKYVHGWKY